MYEWKIVVHLRNNHVVTGIYKGPENNSTDVATKLFTTDCTYTGFFNKSKTGNVFVRNEDVVGFEIDAILNGIDIDKFNASLKGERR